MVLFLRTGALLRNSLLSAKVAQYSKSLVSDISVPLFGKLFVESKSNTRIRSLNPQACPDNDKIKVYSTEKPEVHLDGNTVSINTVKKTSDVTDIEIPFQYELHVKQTENGDTVIENLENKSIDISNTASSIQMRNVKSSRVKATAKQSIHAAKHLQGEVVLETQYGNVMTDRIQGTNVDILCPDGKVDLQAVYCENCTINGEKLSVHTGPTKGHVSVDVEDVGTVDIGDVSGSLEVRMRCGNVKAHVSTSSVIDIDIAEGDIAVTVAPTIGLVLDLMGSEIEVDGALEVSDGERMELHDCQRYTGSLNGEEEIVCRLQTREGKVSVTPKDWCETLVLR